MNDLSLATVDEMFEELVRRSNTVVLGIALPPQRPNEGVLSNIMWKGSKPEAIGLMIMAQAGICNTLYEAARDGDDPQEPENE